MLNGIDLFSGYGGLSLALSEWVRPVAYCENDRYAQGVLLSRMAEQKLPSAPIWDDINTFPATLFKGADVVYGGFPCQDISYAGLGGGLEGKRSGLFYELLRVAKEVQPRFIFLENVPAIRTRGLVAVIAELTNLGYDCRWTCVSAQEVGANHLRKRWFLLAHSNSKGLQGSKETRDPSESRERAKEQPAGLSTRGILHPSSLYPTIREHDGSPYRSLRIKCLGNGLVPQQGREAFKRLMGLK